MIIKWVSMILTLLNQIWYLLALRVVLFLTQSWIFGVSNFLLIASKHISKICLLQWWSIPSFTTCFAVGFLHTRKNTTSQSTGSHSTFRRICDWFNSIWPEPGSCNRFMKLEVNLSFIGISNPHNDLGVIWNSFNFGKEIPFLSTSMSHSWKNGKSWISDGRVNGTPFQIRMVHLQFGLAPSKQIFWICFIHRFLRTRIDTTGLLYVNFRFFSVGCCDNIRWYDS